MGFKIVWTKKAVKTFGHRIDYLKKNWTDKEIFNFTNRVNQYLNTLLNHPQMFRKSYSLKHTHIGVIIKYVSIIYRIKANSNTIEIIAFIDNRQKYKPL